MLTAAQRDSFDRDGFLVLDRFVDARACDELIERADELMRTADLTEVRSIFTTKEQERTSDDYFLGSGGEIRFFFEEEAFAADGELRQPIEDSINKIGHALHDLDPVFDRFSRAPAVTEVATDVGVGDSVLVQSMYLCKQPRIGGEVGCHQDATFLYTDPVSVTGFWFALEDATIDNGCLWAAPGGHRTALRKLFKRAPAGGTEFEVVDPTPLPDPRGGTLVPLEAAKGTLVVLDGRLPHWSDVNRSERSRHAYSVHVIDPLADYPEWNWLQRSQPLRGFSADSLRSVTNNHDVVRVGVLGCGNVGAALVQLIAAQSDAIAARTGIQLRVTRVAVRNLAREREVHLADGVLTRDARSVVEDPDIDVVVEVIGGIEPARELILAALERKKPVVTANKELLANIGTELYSAADASGVDLLFEAAVAGGIPLIRPLRESLRGEPIRRVMGIVNGTTNYILTKMTEDGASYADALAEAQSLGFAERDPTADVEGFDAGAKAAIIATIAFGSRVVAGDVYHEGISAITAADIAVAARLGYVIKLLAICERVDGEIAVRVHPAMVPMAHPLASVRDSYNAVFVEGGAVGSLMFYGRGAGGMPTASAVLGDLIDAAINQRKGAHGSMGTFARTPIRPIDETTAEYQVSFDVVDRPGVLHAVTGVFAHHNVSIRAAEQEGLGDDARLVFITHEAREADLQATLRDLRDLDVVKRVGGLLRVIGG